MTSSDVSLNMAQTTSKATKIALLGHMKKVENKALGSQASGESTAARKQDKLHHSVLDLYRLNASDFTSYQGISNLSVQRGLTTPKVHTNTSKELSEQFQGLTQ